MSLLDEVQAEKMTIALVLERSGVSYESLYHHFNDISNLVEQAIVVRCTRRIKDSLVAVRALLDSRDATDFRQRTEQLLIYSVNLDRGKNRFGRIEAFGAIRRYLRLATRIAKAQKGTDEHTELNCEFQQRDWLRNDVDPAAISLVTQAVVFGRSLSELAKRPLELDLMNDVMIKAISDVSFPD